MKLLIIVCCSDIQTVSVGPSCPCHCWAGVSTPLLQSVSEGGCAGLQSKEDISGESQFSLFFFFFLNVIWFNLLSPVGNKILYSYQSPSLAYSGADSQCAGLYQDVQPLPTGTAADPGGASQRSLLHSWCSQTHRRLCLPHLWSLGEERGAAEPGRPLSKHS